MQLRPGELTGKRGLLAGYKLGVAPLLIMAIYAGIIGLRGARDPGDAVRSGDAADAGRLRRGDPVRPRREAGLADGRGVGTVAAFVTLPAWERAFAIV